MDISKNAESKFGKFLKGLAIVLVSAVSIIVPSSVALGALAQYGLPGIYNASDFTLNNGQGSAIATDVNGRVKISASSALTSLRITNLNATNVSSTIITSTNVVFTQQRFTNAASTLFLNSDTAGWLFNGGYVFAAGPGTSFFSANASVLRGAVSNDTLAALTINGGTSGITNFTTKVGVNSSTPIATLGVKGVGGTNPLVIASSTNALLLQVLQSGQVVIGPNTLAQTGGVVVSHSTANPIALSFTDDTNYTAFMGRPAGTSAQMVVGGQAGTNFNAASNGTVYLTILTSGFVGFSSTTPIDDFVVSGSATTTMVIDSTSSTKGGCIMVKDSDGVGYTYITYNNGAATVSTVSCR